MRDKFHRAGHEKVRERRGNSFLGLLRVFCGEFSLALVLIGLGAAASSAQEPARPLSPENRLHYQIKLSLDFEKRTYSGTERVRWINRGNRATSTL
ncbi:MAG TPA: hypothetical protein VIU65_05640, partial [Pyrinomonadaceae bacterium]